MRATIVNVAGWIGVVVRRRVGVVTVVGVIVVVVVVSIIYVTVGDEGTTLESTGKIKGREMVRAMIEVRSVRVIVPGIVVVVIVRVVAGAIAVAAQETGSESAGTAEESAPGGPEPPQSSSNGETASSCKVRSSPEVDPTESCRSRRSSAEECLR